MGFTVDCVDKGLVWRMEENEMEGAWHPGPVVIIRRLITPRMTHGRHRKGCHPLMYTHLIFLVALLVGVSVTVAKTYILINPAMFWGVVKEEDWSYLQVKMVLGVGKHPGAGS